MTRPQATESTFVDALSGTSGMADPPPTARPPQTFVDALGAPREIDTVRIEMPEVPIPELPSVEELRRRVRDDDLPSVGQAATSAERAEAARKAMAARRDAAVEGRAAASGAVPALAPPRPAGQAPMFVARTGHGSMPLSYPAPSPGTAVSSVPGSAPVRRAGSGPGRTNPGPAQARRRTPASTVRSRHQQRAGGIWGFVVAVIIFLVVSGAGQNLLDAIMRVVGQ